MNQMTHNLKQDRPILLGYFLFFFILFIPFPLTNTLPGNCDTWLAIALSNRYLENIFSFLRDENQFSSLYPTLNIHSFGESSPGLGLLFIIGKLIFQHDLWSYFFFILVQFFLTSYALYKLTSLFVKNRIACFFAGLSFCTTNFTFANIDDTLIIFYFFPLLSLYFFHTCVLFKKKSHILYSFFCFGLIPYFSFYLFFFQSIILFLHLFIYWKHLKFMKKDFLIGSLFVSSFISLPIILFYVINFLDAPFVNPYNIKKVIESSSLHLEDFTKSLPQNFFFSKNGLSELSTPYWSELRRHAFIGLTLPLMALLGFFKINNKTLKKVFLCLGFLGLIFSLGPHIIFKDVKFYSPIKFFYDTVPLLSFLRIPLRAFFLTLLSLSFFSAFGLEYLLKKMNHFKRGYLLAIIIFGLFLIENIPLTLKKYPTFSLEKIPSYYQDILRKYRPFAVLNLPSYIRFDFLDSKKDFYSFNREILYMNWQTKFPHHIPNGVNGYVPKSRMELQHIIMELPSENSLRSLSRKGIHYLLLHKDLFLNKLEQSFFNFTPSKSLELIEESSKHKLFRIHFNNRETIKDR